MGGVCDYLVPYSGGVLESFSRLQMCKISLFRPVRKVLNLLGTTSYYLKLAM